MLFRSEKVNESYIRSQNLILDFDDAIKDHQFLVYLQPQINSYDNTIIGAEALIRWHHPKYGMVPPSEFIPLFEKNMMIPIMSFSLTNINYHIDLISTIPQISIRHLCTRFI